jgi:hypothetical protein
MGKNYFNQFDGPAGAGSTASLWDGTGNFFDRFDAVPAMQLSLPPGVTEVTLPGGQNFTPLPPAGTRQDNVARASSPWSDGSAGRGPVPPSESGGNYFDRFDLESQPPTLLAWPDWMGGSTSSFGPNGLPDWMTDPAPAPAPLSGGNFFDQFDTVAPPAPFGSAPNRPPRAVDYPTSMPIPTPQPASGLNSYQGRGQDRWNAARAQAVANPPVPSSVPAPKPASPPVQTTLSAVNPSMSSQPAPKPLYSQLILGIKNALGGGYDRTRQWFANNGYSDLLRSDAPSQPSMFDRYWTLLDQEQRAKEGTLPPPPSIPVTPSFEPAPTFWSRLSSGDIGGAIGMPIESVRESLSPFFGPTDAQLLADSIPVRQADGTIKYEYKPGGDRIQQEGLFGVTPARTEDVIKNLGLAASRNDVPPLGIAKGVGRAVVGALNSLENPFSLPMVAETAAGKLPGAVHKVISAGFAGNMLAGTPDQITELSRSQSPGETAEQATKLGLSLLLGGRGMHETLKGPLSESDAPIPRTATVWRKGPGEVTELESPMFNQDDLKEARKRARIWLRGLFDIQRKRTEASSTTIPEPASHLQGTLSITDWGLGRTIPICDSTSRLRRCSTSSSSEP